MPLEQPLPVSPDLGPTLFGKLNALEIYGTTVQLEGSCLAWQWLQTTQCFRVLALFGQSKKSKLCPGGPMSRPPGLRNGRGML